MDPQTEFDLFCLPDAQLAERMLNSVKEVDSDCGILDGKQSRLILHDREGFAEWCRRYRAMGLTRRRDRPDKGLEANA